MTYKSENREIQETHP